MHFRTTVLPTNEDSRQASNRYDLQQAYPVRYTRLLIYDQLPYSARQSPFSTLKWKLEARQRITDEFWVYIARG